MSKRQANSDLNSDNWDKDEKKEEPGRFIPIDKTDLKNRVIKKAKRASVEQSNSPGNSSGTSPFAAFSGFSSKGFSFSSNLKSSTPTQESGKSEATKGFSFFSKSNTSNSVPTATTQNFYFTPKIISSSSPNATKIEAKAEGSKQNGNSTKTSKQTEESPAAAVSNSNSKVILARSIEYYRQLQSLNESVIKWMQLHLSKNPCCDFNPVFNDYKKHLDTLNVTYPAKKKEIPTSTAPSSQSKADDFNFKRPSPSSCAGSFSKQSKKSNENENFTSTTNNENLSKMASPKSTDNSPKDDSDKSDYGAHFASNTTNTSTFSFGMKCTPTGTSTATPTGPTTTSSEGDNPENSPTSESNSRSESQDKTEDVKNKPFSFAFTPITRPAETEKSEDVEYVPPKNDIVTVQEEGAIYSKKCKLFFKKGDNFADKGVGNLHLKPLGDRTQLIVRADTNLGNILLNIMLSSTLPISRTGKNNVLIVCVPNPPIDVKNPDSMEAIPMLIRVKTENDADELFETLKKQMKS